MEYSYLKISINTIKITFPSYQGILDIIDKAVTKRSAVLSIGYVNANSVVLSDSNKEFVSVLEKFSLLYADGVGMHLAARMFSYSPEGLWKNFNATEFNFSLLQYADRNKLKLFFVGTHQRSLQKLEIKIREYYPNIVIAGMCDGYEGLNSTLLMERINSSEPAIIFVGMGSPKQEIWLQQHREALMAPVCITVGAFLDFVSGEVNRAPALVRLIRLEWLFRLAQEPRRLWKRYIIGIPVFIYIILRQKISKNLK